MLGCTLPSDLLEGVWQEKLENPEAQHQVTQDLPMLSDYWMDGQNLPVALDRASDSMEPRGVCSVGVMSSVYFRELSG